MFNLSTTTAALTATLAFSSFAYAQSTSNDASAADSAKRSALGNEYVPSGEGVYSSIGNERGPRIGHRAPGDGTQRGPLGNEADKPSAPPSLDDQVRVRRGTTSTAGYFAPTIYTNPWEQAPGFGVYSGEKDILESSIGIERGPGIGHGAPSDGTSGGPLGNEWEKALGLPGFGDQARVPQGTTERAGLTGRDLVERGGPLGDAAGEAGPEQPGLDDGLHAEPLDIDGSGHVDFLDLVELLAAWGRNNGPADLTGDGIVGFRDLAQLLAGMPSFTYEPAIEGDTGSKAPQERSFKRADGRQLIDFGS